MFYPHVGQVTIEGPYNAEGRHRHGQPPQDFRVPARRAPREEDAVRAHDRFDAGEARLPPPGDAPRTCETLMEFYAAGRSEGGTLRRRHRGGAAAHPRGSGVRLSRRAEPAGLAAGKSYRISDLALASRLSFFLWSSIPDDELIDLAAQGRLKDPAVLEQQVRRMLADPKSEALIANFTGQWLSVRALKTSEPVVNLFPDFDDNLRAAFQREIELFFDSIVHEDRSVLDLLTADYTFVNERLAKHYGIPNIYGPQFRRVTLGRGVAQGV